MIVGVTMAESYALKENEGKQVELPRQAGPVKLN